MSFLADALWNELKYGVLARSREAYDACAAHHAAGKVDLVVETAREAFAVAPRNFKDAVEHAWGHIGRRDLRKEFEAHLAGRHDPFMHWLYDAALRHAPDLANSRLFLDPPHPDRVWVQRGNAWDLAWRHERDWKLKSLKEVRASALPPVETLLVVRVAGVERPNPKLPKAP